MVDFFLNYDSLSCTDIRKKLFQLKEKMARYEHHIVFVNTYIHFNVIPRGFQLKFYSNIPDLQIAKILRNCSKMLVFKIVCKIIQKKREYLMT